MRSWLILTCACLVTTALARAAAPPAPMIGMYVHQHWPYKHPYAARTWTVEDWTGYVTALRTLGYNTIIIWPILETMPEPLTPSDRANIEKIARVIDIVHGLNMRVYLTISPNVVPDSAVAGQATFRERHFFHSDIRVNPGDTEAVRLMMLRRESLFRPLAKADGVLIIDSDPGGYPQSTNQEFVNLLIEHRRMFDRLRPGIELVYWVWAGWPAYARYYETGNFAWGTPAEFEEVLTLLKAADPAPWGLAYGLEHARKVGIADKVINLQYGAIEGEPSFPLTNFGGEQAWKAGGNLGPRGIIGNAQTHCVQLPNTLAFVRGARGLSAPTPEDYVAFADDLIRGRGRAIVSGWQTLAGGDSARMRTVADEIGALADQTLEAGPLAGLLFRDPRRFLMDLAAQLRYAAALHAFVRAADAGNELTKPLGEYLAALEAWYARHGYQNFWGAPEAALRKAGSRVIDEVLDPPLCAVTPFGRVKEHFYRKETYTPDLIRAIRIALAERASTRPGS